MIPMKKSLNADTQKTSAKGHDQVPRSLFLIVATGFALRLINLGTASLWQDEVWELLKSDHVVDIFRSGNFMSNHPPFYNVLLACWGYLGLADGEWTARLFPALIGTMTIPMVFVVGKRLCSERIGLVAAFLLAASPFHVLHSQDMKCYILLPLVGTYCVLLFLKAIDRNTWPSWLAYGICAAMACYTEFFAGFLLIGINLWYIALGRKDQGRLFRWFAANAVGALLFVPFLGISLLKAKAIMIDAVNWWIPRPSLLTVAYYFKTLAFGYSDFKPLYPIATAFFLGLFVVGCVVAVRRDLRRGFLLLFWFAVPVLLAFGVSQVTRSIFLFRALLPFSIPFYVLVATGLTAMPWRTARTIFLLLCLLFPALPLYQHYNGIYPLLEFPHRPGTHPPIPYKEAADYIKAQWRDGDIVISPGGEPSYLPFHWYGIPGRFQYRVEVREEAIEYFFKANPPLTADHDEFRNYMPRQLQPLVKDRDRVWFVFGEWERLYLSGSPQAVWQWMDSHFSEIRHQRFGDIDIFLYARTVDGEPIVPVMRRWDSGVSAGLLYNTSLDGEYVKTDPDSGLIPTPEEQRQGALLVSLVSDTDTLNGSLQTALPARQVSLQNRSDKPAQVRVERVLSDALLPMASLFEADPDSPSWTVGTMFDPSESPPNYPIPCALSNLTGEVTASLIGTAVLHPGTYATTYHSLGTPGRKDFARATLSITIAEQQIVKPFRVTTGSPLKWEWVQGQSISIPPGHETQKIAVVSSKTEPTQEAFADLHCVAFLKSEHVGLLKRAGESTEKSWEFVIPAGETVMLDAVGPVLTGRLDVWVYELGGTGMAYHVFQQALF